MSGSETEPVEVTANLSESGLSIKLRSRITSAFDRLLGNKVTRSGLDTEREITLHRIQTDMQAKVLEAAGRVLTKEMDANPEVARRILFGFEKVANRQCNVNEVAVLALEDLQSHRIDQQPSGPEDNLSNEFLDRLERYAEEATTERLREKWARVLSAELRTPGTFTLKTLRVIDELESADADLFERACELRIGKFVPGYLFDQKGHLADRLAAAGLFAIAPMGHTLRLGETTTISGEPAWICRLGQYGFAMTVEGAPSHPRFGGSESLLVGLEGAPYMPVYTLSDVGVAVATILPDRQKEALRQLAAALSQARTTGKVMMLEYTDTQMLELGEV